MESSGAASKSGGPEEDGCNNQGEIERSGGGRGEFEEEANSVEEDEYHEDGLPGKHKRGKMID